MKNHIHLIPVFAFAIMCPLLCLAQSFSVERRMTPSVSSNSQATPFTSQDGRFAVALPQEVSGYEPISRQTPGGRITGEAYTWVTAQGTFRIGYADRPDLAGGPEKVKSVIEDIRIAIAKSAGKYQGKVVSERPLTLAGFQGVEFVTEQAKMLLTSRFFIVDKRLYHLVAALPEEKRSQEAAVVKVLDSFRLITEADVQAALRKKIEEATPSPLPQEPVAKRRRTDAEDDGLKGRVRIVECEDQDLSGTWTVQRRKPSFTAYYNELGNRTKRESRDYRGNPMDVTVYGYLDGDRVSNIGSIRHEYNPPLMMAPPSAAGGSKPRRDMRYTYKFKHKYDDQGRLAEMTMYSNDGKLWMRYVYKYEGNRREELVYAEDGSLNQKYVTKLDDKGIEVEKESWDVTSGKIRDRYSYHYEFDTQGNWVKRTTLKWAEKDGKSGFEPSHVTWRKISYYEK